MPGSYSARSIRSTAAEDAEDARTAGSVVEDTKNDAHPHDVRVLGHIVGGHLAPPHGISRGRCSVRAIVRDVAGGCCSARAGVVLQGLLYGA